MRLYSFLFVQILWWGMGFSVASHAQEPRVKISGSVEVFQPLKGTYQPAHNITLKLIDDDSGRTLLQKKVDSQYSCFIRPHHSWLFIFEAAEAKPTYIRIHLAETGHMQFTIPVILFPAEIDAEENDTLKVEAFYDPVMGLVMPGFGDELAKKEATLMANYTRAWLQRLEQADEAAQRGDRTRALEYYQKAMHIAPDNEYVTARVAEVEKQLSASSKAYFAYLQTVQLADSLFQRGEMEEARIIYSKALALQHHDNHPNRQISTIERWKEEQNKRERQARFQEKRCKILTQEADAYFYKRLTRVARQLYMDALEICEDKAYLKEQIARIDAIHDRKQRLFPKESASVKDYHSRIATADSLMQQKAYDQARPIYQTVYRQFPELPYAHRQLVKLHLIQSFLEYRDQRCNQLKQLAQTDTFFAHRSGHTEVAYWLWAHCPYSLFDKDSIASMQRFEKEITSDNPPDDTLLAMADRNFERGNYLEALKQYHNLEQKYRHNSFLKARIQVLHTLMAGKMDERLHYDSLVYDASLLLLNNQVRQAYEKYLRLEQLDTATFIYRQRLGVEQMLLLLEEEEILNEAFRAKRQQADKLFLQEKYEAAENLYKEALELDPTKKYPRMQLDALESLQEKHAQEVEQKRLQRKRFTELLYTADSLVDIGELKRGRARYLQAQQMDSSSTFLRNRLDLTNRLIKESRKEIELIDSLFIMAEMALENRQLHQASRALNRALQQDPVNKRALRMLATVQERQFKESKREIYYALWEEVQKRALAGRYLYACNLMKQLIKSYPDSLQLKHEAERLCLLAQTKKPEVLEAIPEDSILLALSAKAHGYFIDGKLEEAALLYQELMALYPNDADIKQNRAEVAQQIKQNQLTAKETIDLSEKDTLSVLEQPYIEAFNLPDTVERVTYLRNLANQYPEGVTIEHSKLKGRKLTRYIVVKDGWANEYWKVQHDWGGVFYFKNGRSISYNVFTLEINP